MQREPPASARKVGHIAQRVAHRFAIHRLGACINQLGKRGRVACIGKAHLNAHLREGVGKQVVGAAVQREADTMLSPASAMV
jgi:hypothetical protein